MVFFLLFILGLIFGSFIAALSYRYPKNISILKGRSFCDRCRKKISWYDNIPLISYVFLGGKCRNCKKHISLRYPIIEIVTAIGFIVLTFKGGSLQGAYSIIVFLILELIFVVDLEHQIIPDDFIFFGLTISVLYFLFAIPYSLFSNLFAGLSASTFLLLVHLLTHGRGMGLGDVKFAILGGLLTGINLFLIWLLLAFLTGAIAGIILILAKKAELKGHIAFGPFLVITIPIALVYGPAILQLINF